jgi:hypothetical protein
MLLNTSDFTCELPRLSFFRRKKANQYHLCSDSAWPVTITSTAEPAIAIFVVCLAHLRPLMRQIFPKGWFSITEEPSWSDVVTFGRLGGRSNSTDEIALDERPRPGTYSQSPPIRDTSNNKGY